MYEPNPSPDQAEAFQPIGGKPLALYARDAAFLAKKGQAAPIMEPSPSRRKLLNKRIEGDAELAELAEDEKELGPLIGTSDEDAAAEPAAPVAAPPAPLSIDELFEEQIDAALPETLPETRPEARPETRPVPQHEKRDVKMQAPESAAAVAPPARAASPRASVAFDMSATEFLRLSIAAEALGRPAQEIIADAVQLYLDAQGVERIDDLARFVKAARRAD